MFYKKANMQRPYLTYPRLMGSSEFKLFRPLLLNQLNETGKPFYRDSCKYEVTRVHNDDGQHVNVGDLLFVLKPVEEAVEG